MAGTTPARTGNVNHIYLHIASLKNHLRSHGEYSYARTVRSSMVESPPLVRGICDHPDIPPLPPGITPACTGNRNWVAGSQPCRKNHPRMYGEYLPRTSNCRADIESPLRVRGISICSDRRRESAGITPAHAGNITPIPCHTSSYEDYLRSHGEYTDTKSETFMYKLLTII